MNSGRESSEDLRSLLLPQLWRRMRTEVVPELVTKEPPQSLGDVQRYGMLLQSAIAQGNDDRTAGLAEQLEKLAHLGEEVNRDDGKPAGAHPEIDLERIAAAFHLWPFHSARYYGNGNFGRTDEIRIKGRQCLCAIQRILFAEIRWTLDFLRLSFGVRCYEEIEPWLADNPNPIGADEPRRIEVEENGKVVGWRPKELCSPVVFPDLCAVDWLCCTMIDLVRSRKYVRDSVSQLHQLSIETTQPDGTLLSRINEDIRRAFHSLHVAQITVFYSPNITSPSLPLEELVFDALKRERLLELDPDALIPFFDGCTFFDDRGRPSVTLPSPDVDRNAFRALASAIYSSSRDSTTHQRFRQQREVSINYDKPFGVRFVSSGEITYQFLTADSPPFEEWPAWYKKSLTDLPSSIGELPDWSNAAYWWDNVDIDVLAAQLFPGDSHDPVHRNHHAAAYVDFRASGKSTETALIDNWETLNSQLTNRSCQAAARFGYLMELLLRRSEEYARTSFLFVMSQTHEEKPRIAQFVGGTFLGLERPGVPYAEGRFRDIADYLRPLILAIANYCTNRMVRQKQKDKERSRTELNVRVRDVIRLMEGIHEDFARTADTADGQHIPGYLLFTGDDHDDYKTPSWQQVANLFSPHWAADEVIPVACKNTWKSLLYMPENSNIWTYEDFIDGRLRGTPDKFEESAKRPARSQREAMCDQCVKGALKYLFGNQYQEDSWVAIENIDPSTCSGILFPSRPGIRYLISLVRFVIEANVEGPDRVQQIRLGPGLTIVDFGNAIIVPELLRKAQFHPTSNKLRGAFNDLQVCCPLTQLSGDEIASSWAAKFLNHPMFGGGYEVVISGSLIEIRWLQ